MTKWVKPHNQAIIILSIVSDRNPTYVHEFYKKLLTHILSLETMGKLNTIEGCVNNALDKLPRILLDIVRLDRVC